MMSVYLHTAREITSYVPFGSSLSGLWLAGGDDVYQQFIYLFGRHELSHELDQRGFAGAGLADHLQERIRLYVFS